MLALLSVLSAKLVVPLWFAVLLIAERLRPADKRKFPKVRFRRNLSLWGINVVLSLLFVVPLTAFAAQTAPDWRPDALRGPFAFALDLLVLDLWIWAWHRANHEIPFLWRFHEVHHLDETLDVTSAVRFHFGEVALSACVRAAVIWTLAVPLATVLIFEAIVLLAALFHHSNLALPPRLEALLAKVIITPSIHWVHHHAVRADTDSRYGTLFSFWDRIFSTRTPARRTADMKIGVAGRQEQTLLALLRRPFVRARDTA